MYITIHSHVSCCRSTSRPNIRTDGHNLENDGHMVRGKCSLQADKVYAGRSDLQLDLCPCGSVNRQIRRHYPPDEFLRQL